MKALSYLYFEEPTPVISDKIKILGFNFSNRVGLASGMDKNADYIDSLSHLGFGFLELGTVTPRAQAGNAKPRLFRLTEKRSLLNSMGFNNKGVEHAVLRIQKNKSKAIIGLSIGKNYDTPLEKAIEDYLFCFERAYPVSDYIAVNISSPNTEDLRQLESEKYFSSLITSLKKKQESYSKSLGYKPIILKLSPDLEESNLEYICKEILDKDIDGIICSNTTISHKYPQGGGLSGEELFEFSNKSLISFRSFLGSSFPIIASGGVMSRSHYKKKLELGADLVQVYTGMIYKGPILISEILRS
ncbi:MAG: quinone-dependent dihydroorotate dehydrogenase [SAR86 cluster bacterium]|nr:quinone-dependent dihydroorotate dehydrogenase [SAR86 cluster bacterium]